MSGAAAVNKPTNLAEIQNQLKNPVNTVFDRIAAYQTAIDQTLQLMSGDLKTGDMIAAQQLIKECTSKIQGCKSALDEDMDNKKSIWRKV